MPVKHSQLPSPHPTARVTGRMGDRYLLDDNGHEIQATVTGRFRLKAQEAGDFPVPGGTQGTAPGRLAVLGIERGICRDGKIGRTQGDRTVSCPVRMVGPDADEVACLGPR